MDRSTPLRQRKRRSPAELATRNAVFARDGYCRLAGSTLGPCIGERLTPHHLRKEGQGGQYTMRNLLTLCAGHNSRIETMRRADGEAAGLVIPHAYADDVGTAWHRLQLAGIVDYWWDGTPMHRPRPDDITRP